MPVWTRSNIPHHATNYHQCEHHIWFSAGCSASPPADEELPLGKLTQHCVSAKSLESERFPVKTPVRGCGGTTAASFPPHVPSSPSLDNRGPTLIASTIASILFIVSVSSSFEPPL